MVVSLERYMCVAHPLKAMRLWTNRFTKLTILVCYLVGFAISIPYFFQRKIEKEPPPGYTEWGKSDGATAFQWIRMLFIKTIPIIVVTILNSMLIYSIWKFNRKRSLMILPGSSLANLTASQQLQMRVTTMVISISVVYVVCHIPEPFAHPGPFGTFFGFCSLFGRGHRTMIIITNVLDTFSYASNFFFYYVFNKHFASALNSMCCCNNQKNSIDIHMSTSHRT